MGDDEKKNEKSANVYPRWGKACVDTWGDDDEIILGNESHMELTMKKTFVFSRTDFLIKYVMTWVQVEPFDKSSIDFDITRRDLPN